MKFKRTFFAEQLRKVLFERNLTQEDLGNMIGVKRPMISQWIRGARNPSLKSAKKIAEVLNIPLNYLTDEKYSTALNSPSTTTNQTTVNNTKENQSEQEPNTINLLINLIREQKKTSELQAEKTEQILKNIENIQQEIVSLRENIIQR